jgi:hypothetical protein
MYKYFLFEFLCVCMELLVWNWYGEGGWPVFCCNVLLWYEVRSPAAVSRKNLMVWLLCTLQRDWCCLQMGTGTILWLSTSDCVYLDKLLTLLCKYIVCCPVICPFSAVLRVPNWNTLKQRMGLGGWGCHVAGYGQMYALSCNCGDILLGVMMGLFVCGVRIRVWWGCLCVG